MIDKSNAKVVTTNENSNDHDSVAITPKILRESKATRGNKNLSCKIPVVDVASADSWMKEATEIGFFHNFGCRQVERLSFVVSP